MFMTIGSRAGRGARHHDRPADISQLLDYLAGSPADGDLLLRQSGLWNRFAKGTGGQGLRTNIAGTGLEYTAGWEVIEIASPAGVASYSKTGLGNYRKIKIEGWFLPATDNTALLLRTDANGGASFDTSGYVYVFLNASGTSTGVNNGSDTAMYLSVSGRNNTTDGGILVSALLDDFNQAKYAKMVAYAGHYSSAPAYTLTNFYNQRQDSNARDAIQILFSSGNIAASHFIVSGLRG